MATWDMSVLLVSLAVGLWAQRSLSDSVNWWVFLVADSLASSESYSSYLGQIECGRVLLVTPCPPSPHQGLLDDL